MHTLDAVQLYVRGRRGAGDEGQGPSFSFYRLLELREGFRDETNDLILLHHAQVVVRQKRQGAAALPLARVEDDRAGLGDA